MLQANSTFAKPNRHWLRAIPPEVVRLDVMPPRLLDLKLPPVKRPGGRRDGCPRPWQTLRAYNPAVTAAPPSLCPRCAYVLAVRADAMNQCVRDGALRSSFAGTAIAVLDSSLTPLAWSWLYDSPHRDLGADRGWRQGRANGSRTSSTPQPPWESGWIDTRPLLLRDGHLYATTNCRCDRFLVAHLQLSEVADGRGGLSALRAWVSAMSSSSAAWGLGRNQVLFEARVAGEALLMAQPWFETLARIGNGPPRVPPSAWSTDPQVWRRWSPRDRSNAEGFRAPTLLPGALVNVSAALWARWWGGTRGSRRAAAAEGGAAAAGPPRISPTANLLRVRRGSCAIYLGIAHMHRGRSTDGPGWRMRTSEYGRVPEERVSARKRRLHPFPDATFRFGSRYTHFWYALEPQPPFRVVATSGEFCLAAEQDATDCESIQFVSGLAAFQGRASRLEADGTEPHAAGSSTEFLPRALLLSFGVNDCEAKLGVLSLERAWNMLRPLSSNSTGRRRRRRDLCAAGHL